MEKVPLSPRESKANANMFADKSGLLTLHYGKHHVTLVDEIKLWFLDENFTDVVIVCDDDDDEEEEEEEGGSGGQTEEPEKTREEEKEENEEKGKMKISTPKIFPFFFSFAILTNIESPTLLISFRFFSR